LISKKELLKENGLDDFRLEDDRSKDEVERDDNDLYNISNFSV
jgi:hypothetical protein